MRKIDADSLIKNIRMTASLDGWIGDVLQEIKNIAIYYIETEPTVNEWIPTSERLPDKEELYRVTVHPDYIRDGDYQVDDYYWKDGKWMYLDWCDFKLYEAEDTVVIAWKPLEEPYKE